MITYREMGSMGRLGNQIFQYAALYGTGFIRGYDIGIPNKDLEIRKTFKLPSAKLVDREWTGNRYNEQTFHFQPGLWMLNDGMDIYGYFQSPHYWFHCAQQVYDELEFHEEIVEAGDKWLEAEGLNDKVLCSMHVRRGDYTNLSDYHHNLDMNYYREAHQVVQKLDKEVSYLTFSDDTEWCKDKFSGSKIVEGNSAQVDLYLMSKCHVHIMANSSFSWWGAFLSNSQAVVAPQKWFGPSGPQQWDTIYMPHWVRV